MGLRLDPELIPVRVQRHSLRLVQGKKNFTLEFQTDVEPRVHNLSNFIAIFGKNSFFELPINIFKRILQK